MPYDPELIDETQAWFRKAAADLASAAALLASSPPLLGPAVFHAQQAAEESLKGFLTWHSSPLGKTHNLEKIGEQCLRIDPSLKPLVDRAAPLTDYAWKFRYPGDPEDPAREEAEATLATAREVYEAILARLPAEVRP